MHGGRASPAQQEERDVVGRRSIAEETADLVEHPLGHLGERQMPARAQFLTEPLVAELLRLVLRFRDSVREDRRSPPGGIVTDASRTSRPPSVRPASLWDRAGDRTVRGEEERGIVARVDVVERLRPDRAGPGRG